MTSEQLFPSSRRHILSFSLITSSTIVSPGTGDATSSQNLIPVLLVDIIPNIRIKATHAPSLPNPRGKHYKAFSMPFLHRFWPSTPILKPKLESPLKIL